MQRYFLPYDYDEQATFELRDSDFHHAKNVMRMTVDDECFLVFQNQVAIKAIIVSIEESTIVFSEVSKEETQKEMMQ